MVDNPIFLYEISYYNTDTLTEEVLRLSTRGYISRPTDTPANTQYKDLVYSSGSLSAYMFGSGRTTGSSSLGIGDFTILNDGSLDYLLGYGFDLRSFRILSVTGPRVSYASANVIFTGLVESAEFSLTEINFKIRSPLAYLDIQAATATFLGNNGASTVLLEGSTDLKGKIKPFVYGKVFNIAPPLINSNSLMYGVNFNLAGSPIEVTSIDAVRDGEVELTFQSNYATSALLAAASLSAGKYSTCLAEGIFRLESSPAFVITCDVTEGSTAADRTPGSLAYRLAVDRSDVIDSSFFKSGTVAALDAKTSAVEGIYVEDSSTIIRAVDDMLNPIGCSLIGDTEGLFVLARLETPGTSVLTLQSNSIYKDGYSMSNDGVPVWKATIGYAKNYTVQSESNVAGSAITSGRVEFSKVEFRKQEDEDPSVKVAYKSSDIYSSNTLLTSSSDADTEAARQLALRSVFRKIWTVPTSSKTILNLGDTITILDTRFNMQTGWDGVIIGYEYDFRKNEITYQVYG